MLISHNNNMRDHLCFVSKYARKYYFYRYVSKKHSVTKKNNNKKKCIGIFNLPVYCNQDKTNQLSIIGNLKKVNIDYNL